MLEKLYHPNGRPDEELFGCSVSTLPVPITILDAPTNVPYTVTLALESVVIEGRARLLLLRTVTFDTAARLAIASCTELVVRIRPVPSPVRRPTE